MQRQIAFGMALALALNGLTWPSVAEGCSYTALVTLNVGVTDPDGNVVEGLKHTDFSVTEDGRVQQIAVFAFQGPDLDLTPPAVNRGSFGYLNHRLITLLFDFTMMPRSERTRIQDDAIDFIRNDLKPGELLSIETVTAGSVEMTQNFTADQTALVAAVNKFRTSGDGVTDNVAGGNPSEFDVFNADGMLARIATVCGRLPMRIPTRKSLLYFATAIDPSGADNQAALGAAANACTKSDFAIYPIGAASAGIAELATQTGGQTFSGRRPAIDEVRRKSEPYYVLGYYSTNDRRDGGYRKVELKLKSPGFQQAKLGYSHGYFTETELPRFTEAYREDYFRTILGLGDPIVDLPLAVEVNYFRMAKDLYLVPVSVKLPGTAIALEKKWNFSSAQLDFQEQITSGKQPVTWTLKDSMVLPLAQSTMAELSSTPVTRITQTLLPAGAYHLNLLVREREIGLVGTYREDLKIPGFGEGTGNVLMSSMVLGTEWRPAAQQNDVPQPMVENGSALVPSVTHVFGKGQSVSVYAEAYDSVPGQGGRPEVTATVSLVRGNDVVFESRTVILDQFIPRRDRTLAVNLEVPLAGLAAGTYTVRLALVDENGHKSGFRDAEIGVLSDAVPGVPELPAPPDGRSYQGYPGVVCF